MTLMLSHLKTPHFCMLIKGHKKYKLILTTNCQHDGNLSIKRVILGLICGLHFVSEF